MLSGLHRRRARSWVVLGAIVAALGVGSSGRAEDPEPAEPPPHVSLDRLFKLPTNVETVEQREERRVSGATRSEWEARFRQAHQDLAGAHASLKGAQAELEEMAANADAWQLTAPGAQVNAENSPVSYKLRQDIRRYREDIERYEAALTELRIEANLAGVPASWQRVEVQSSDAQERLADRNARPGNANRPVSAK